MTFPMKLKIFRAFYKIPLLEGARIRRCALLLHDAPLIRARFPLQLRNARGEAFGVVAARRSSLRWRLGHI